MQFWCIIDEHGKLVMEGNRMVPRLYATRQRAEEKIAWLGTAGKWQVRMIKLTIL